MSEIKCRSRMILLLAALVCLCVLPTAFGQVAAAPAVDAGSADTMSLKQIMHVGGGVMYVLAAASILTVTFVIYFLYIMRVSYVAPRFLQREVMEKIRAGANIDEVQRICEDNPCPLSMIVVTGVDYIKGAGPNMTREALKDVMEGEGARQADDIQGRAQYLLDIAVLSPMLGLLGTVVGMLQAFNAVALVESAGAKPVALMGGVSKALVATAFGLIVGIPSMAFYGHFRRKASKVVSSLEVTSLQIYAALTSRSSK